MSDINILDPLEAPFVTLRMVSRDKVTRDIASETVNFEADLTNDTFIVSSGKTQVRFGRNRERKVERSLNEWETVMKSYINRGFEFVTTEKIVKKSFTIESKFKGITNKAIAKFIDAIISSDEERLKRDLTKSIDEIPKECLDAANETLVKLQQDYAADALTVKSFNQYLKELFTQLPIAVSKADNYFAVVQDSDHFKDVISRLQEKLDSITQTLEAFYKEKEEVENGTHEREDVLSANHLEMRDITPDEKKKILEYMSDQSANFVRAWHVTNTETEKRFQEYCDKRGITEENGGISHLWHGTGFENLWSIFKHGLYLNPALIKSDVRICGKAFGYGIYFAPYCRKSMGYTSSCAAMYRGGSGDRGGYLLIFKVATGNPYYYYRGTDKKGSKLENHYCPMHWSDFHSHIPDCDVLWAEAGQEGDEKVRRLCFDEVIAYQQEQATIEYIVEFSDISW